jgi:predicted CoA-binding protein
MAQKVLVLGASLKDVRYSNMAIKLLIRYGHDVYAIGNREGEVDGVSIIKEHPIIDELDTLTLYLNPSNQQPLIKYILELNPKRVIFNPGTENPVLRKELDAAEIAYEEACTLVLLRSNQFDL